MEKNEFDQNYNDIRAELEKTYWLLRRDRAFYIGGVITMLVAFTIGTSWLAVRGAESSFAIAKMENDMSAMTNRARIATENIEKFQAKTQRSVGTNVAGLGGIAVSLPVSRFSMSGSNYVSAKELTVTISTMGHPVHLALMPIASANSEISSVAVNANAGGFANQLGCDIQIIADGTRCLGQTQCRSGGATGAFNGVGFSTSGFQWMDFGATAGTHTYQIQLKLNSTGTAELDAVCLVAYEL